MNEVNTFILAMRAVSRTTTPVPAEILLAGEAATSAWMEANPNFSLSLRLERGILAIHPNLAKAELELWVRLVALAVNVDFLLGKDALGQKAPTLWMKNQIEMVKKSLEGME